MKKKKRKFDDSTLYLPHPSFKRRFMPPSRISVDPGDWEKTPLFLASVRERSHQNLSLFDPKKKEVIE